ncbi:hypothetical protein HMPREF0580_0268 [Mobiluncus mulieris ATCC 35239]|uniref:Transmembrane protein n=2 Tax=Mobiluncus mulieris TaxID=2052 RepID=E0QN04_9ACTO|nr:hypothetical protein HMPREF0580_0268 [Mobiluncus mulieris ATCC 35239]
MGREMCRKPGIPTSLDKRVAESEYKTTVYRWQVCQKRCKIETAAPAESMTRLEHGWDFRFENVWNPEPILERILMLDNFAKCLDMDCVKRVSGDVAQNAAGTVVLARDAVEEFSARMKRDLLPRAQAAQNAVTKAVTGEGSLKSKVMKASDGVMTALNPPKKKCPIGHPWLLTVVVAGAAAVIGFVLWSRSRPVEDPWAEESWEDIDDDDLVVVTDYGEEGEDK